MLGGRRGLLGMRGSHPNPKPRSLRPMPPARSAAGDDADLGLAPEVRRPVFAARSAPPNVYFPVRLREVRELLDAADRVGATEAQKRYLFEARGLDYDKSVAYYGMVASLTRSWQQDEVYGVYLPWALYPPWTRDVAPGPWLRDPVAWVRSKTSTCQEVADAVVAMASAVSRWLVVCVLLFIATLSEQPDRSRSSSIRRDRRG